MNASNSLRNRWSITPHANTMAASFTSIRTDAPRPSRGAGAALGGRPSARSRCPARRQTVDTSGSAMEVAMTV